MIRNLLGWHSSLNKDPLLHNLIKVVLSHLLNISISQKASLKTSLQSSNHTNQAQFNNNLSRDRMIKMNSQLNNQSDQKIFQKKNWSQ